MKSVIYVNTETLKRDLFDAEVSLCLVEPLRALIENRNDNSFYVEVCPLIMGLIKELSGHIIVNINEKYEIWHFEIGEKFFIFLV